MNAQISGILLSRKMITPCPLVLVVGSLVRRSIPIAILCRIRAAYRKYSFFFGRRHGKARNPRIHVLMNVLWRGAGRRGAGRRGAGNRVLTKKNADPSSASMPCDSLDVFPGLYLRDVGDVVFSYHSLDALFRVYDGDHLQIVSGKKLAERFLIQMLRRCDHVGPHSLLDCFVAGCY
jgi:hypothetical protein